MNPEEFRALVREMRAMQAAWFKNHDRIALDLAKKLERDVDRELANDGQKGLPFGGDA